MIVLQTPDIPNNFIIKGEEIYEFSTRGKRYDNNLIWVWVRFQFGENIFERGILFNVNIFPKISDKIFNNVKFILIKKRKYGHLILLEE